MSEYLSTFSMDNWKRLKTEDKTKHTLVDCVACYEGHREQQQLFPIGPPFVPDALSVSIPSTSAMSERLTAKRALTLSGRLLQICDTRMRTAWTIVTNS